MRVLHGLSGPGLGRYARLNERGVDATLTRRVCSCCPLSTTLDTSSVTNIMRALRLAGVQHGSSPIPCSKSMYQYDMITK